MRRAALPHDEVVVRRGFRLTSVLRTVADLSRRPPLVEAVVAADMVLHQRLIEPAHLQAYIAAHAGRKGVAHLRHVAELREPASESPMETRLRVTPSSLVEQVRAAMKGHPPANRPRDLESEGHSPANGRQRARSER